MASYFLLWGLLPSFTVSYTAKYYKILRFVTILNNYTIYKTACIEYFVKILWELKGRRAFVLHRELPHIFHQVVHILLKFSDHLLRPADQIGKFSRHGGRLLGRCRIVLCKAV